jgi:RND family efflux transporter MFP subunit
MRKLPLKKFAPAVVVIGTIVLAAAIMATRPSPTAVEPPPPQPVGVQAMRVATDANSPQVITQGNVRVRHRVELVSRVAGEIESVTPLFNEGSQFQQGDLLATIEDQDYRNALAQARAELANASQVLAQEQAQANQARQEWRDLGSAEANSLFLREPQLRTAQARYEAAQAALDQAELNLQRTQIHAPFNGEIETLSAGLGQYVSPGTSLASVRSTDELEVRLSATGTQLRSLGWSNWIGKPIESPPQVELSWTGPSGEAVAQGTLRSIGSVIASNTQLYAVFIDLSASDNLQGLPDPGQFVEAQLVGNPRENSLWVPRTALFERDNVLLIKDGALTPQKVEILAQTDSEALITGVASEEVLVRQRPLWVIPGQPVTPLFSENQ